MTVWHLAVGLVSQLHLHQVRCLVVAGHLRQVLHQQRLTAAHGTLQQHRPTRGHRQRQAAQVTLRGRHRNQQLTTSSLQYKEDIISDKMGFWQT